MQIKFNYTNGLEFKDPYDRNYVGYFNIDSNGNAYSGRYKSDSSKLLQPYDNISSDFHLSKFFKDRIVFDDFQFPNSLESILIASNELVTNKVIDYKFKLIDENLMYLYSRMFSGDMDVPDSVPLALIPNQGQYDLHNLIFWKELSDTIKDSYRTDIAEYPEIQKMKKFVVVPFTRKDGYAIFGITDTHFISFKTFFESGKLNYAKLFIYQQVIDNNTSQKCFNLEDITYDGTNIYVTDSKINDGGQVFKYDVISHTGNDFVYDDKRYLLEAIGGYGTFLNKNKFKGCSTIGSKEKELWIYDSGNNCIKVFFETFVWKRTLRLDTSTHDYKILCIKHRKLTNEMYVLFRKTNKDDSTDIQFGFLIYGEKYNLVRTEIFEDTFFDKDTTNTIQADIEGFQRFDFSNLDSNVVYVITEINVHKKFLTNTKKSFAVFDRNKIFSNTAIDQAMEDLTDSIKFNALDIISIEQDKDFDCLFVLAQNSILFFQEKCNYVSMLKRNDLNYYPYKDIILDKNEYVQSFILNKEFFKLYSNLLQLKNNLEGRLEYFFNDYGDVAGNEKRYLLDEEINSLKLEINFNCFFNDNELVDPNVINRHFIIFYNIMQKTLDLTKDYVLNNVSANIRYSSFVGKIPFDKPPTNSLGNPDVYIIT